MNNSKISNNGKANQLILFLIGRLLLLHGKMDQPDLKIDHRGFRLRADQASKSVMGECHFPVVAHSLRLRRHPEDHHLASHPVLALAVDSFNRRSDHQAVVARSSRLLPVEDRSVHPLQVQVVAHSVHRL